MGGLLANNIDQVIPYVIFLTLLILINILQPGVLNSSWLGTKVDGTMTLIFAAAGQSFVMLIQGMDLSIAGVICLTNSISALYMPDSFLGIIGTVLVMILVGMAAGAINGAIIVKFRIQPFITTLAMWFIWGGVALWVLPIDGGVPPEGYVDTLLGRVLGIPAAVLLIVLLLVFWSYIRRTRFGVSVFAIGSNEMSAYYSGINVRLVKIKVYAISGMFAALAGLFRTAHVASGSPTAGNDYILLSFCAAVLGGINVTGGRGGLYGTVVGAFILRLLADLLTFAGVSAYWTALVQGCLLIFAVGINSGINIINRKRRLEVR